MRTGDTYSADPTGTVSRNGKVYATVHPGVGDVEAQAREIAALLQAHADGFVALPIKGPPSFTGDFSGFKDPFA